mmetsp:Transcript_7616/g.13112  ORF Transcript_7616/g.13112 Transcript_7616/m.13112 type:complete len:345 (-) Transcript_7616:320-1354(-)
MADGRHRWADYGELAHAEQDALLLLRSLSADRMYRQGEVGAQDHEAQDLEVGAGAPLADGGSTELMAPGQILLVHSGRNPQEVAREFAHAGQRLHRDGELRQRWHHAGAVADVLHLQGQRLCQCLQPSLTLVAPHRENLASLDDRMQSFDQAHKAFSCLLCLLTEHPTEVRPLLVVHRRLPQRVLRGGSLELQELQQSRGHVVLLQLKSGATLLIGGALLRSLEELTQCKQGLLRGGEWVCYPRIRQVQRARNLHKLRTRLPVLDITASGHASCRQLFNEGLCLPTELVWCHFLVLQLPVHAALSKVLGGGEALRPAQRSMAQHEVPKHAVWMGVYCMHDPTAN